MADARQDDAARCQQCCSDVQPLAWGRWSTDGAALAKAGLHTPAVTDPHVYVVTAAMTVQRDVSASVPPRDLPRLTPKFAGVHMAPAWVLH